MCLSAHAHAHTHAHAHAHAQYTGAFLAQKFIVAFRDHDGGKRASTTGSDDAKAGKEE